MALEVLALGIFVLFEPVLCLLKSLLDLVLIVLLDLFGELLLILDGVAHRVNVILERVLGIDLFLQGLVLVSELLGIANHGLDLFLAEAAFVICDSDALALASTLLVGSNRENAVFIDFEGDLNLRHSAGSGWDSGKIELAKHMVILGHGTLALEDLDGDGSLLVLVSSEGLGLLGRDNSTTRDDLCHHSAHGLDAQSKRGNVDQKDILCLLRGLTTKDATLNCSAIGDGLIWVNTTVRLLSIEEILNELLHLGNTSGATDENDLIDVCLLHTGVVENLLNGLQSLLEEVIAKLFEAGTGDGLGEVDSVNEIFDRNLCLMDAGQITLGLLNFTLEELN